MSATVSPQWLDTPDHSSPWGDDVLNLNDADFADKRLSARRNAVKTVSEAKDIQGGSGYEKRVADLARERHRPGTLTLVIVNTVDRARKVFDEITKGIKTEKRIVERAAGKRKAAQGSLLAGDGVLYPRVRLLHSRFRVKDRAAILRESALSGAPLDAAGEIVAATQAVEAGVDASARLLISEIAPWSSMVQRLGRCSRAGEFDPDGGGEFVWLNRATKNEAAPYELKSVEKSAEIMRGFEGKSASPAALESQRDALGEAEYVHILRRRDVIDAFDNSADLSGGYTDISRYVRNDDDKSAFVFWRNSGGGGDFSESLSGQISPSRDELVSVPIGDFKKYLSAKIPKGKTARSLWVWDFVVGVWKKIGDGEVRPGTSVMLDAQLGGYLEGKGWNVSDWSAVNPVEPERGEIGNDGHESDPYSVGARSAVTLSDHSRGVEREAAAILSALGIDEKYPATTEAVKTAALFHDVGKVHPAFQTMLRGGEEPNDGEEPLAKSGVGAGARIESERRQFRHEIGSAMAVLQNADNLAEGNWRDLAAYLAMSHHGKVRIRLQPLSRGANAIPPKDFLLGYGVELAESLKPVDLGEGLECPETRVDISSESRMGSADGVEERSWQDRATEVLERLGPFLLTFLEAITRAADRRASAKERSECP